MYRLNLWGYLLATAGRIGVIAAGYMGSLPMMLVFTAVAAVGISPLQGDINALVAACAENIYMTTGYRLDGTVYSFTSCGVKLGGALERLCAAGFWLFPAMWKMRQCRQMPQWQCCSFYTCGCRCFYVLRWQAC